MMVFPHTSTWISHMYMYVEDCVICQQWKFSSFPILNISFSSLIALTRTSKTTLSSTGESEHSCLVPILEEMLSVFLHQGKCSLWNCCYGFIMLRYVPFLSVFWRIFIINVCRILSKAFSASTKKITWFLSFSLYYGVSHWLICNYWRILVSLEWSPLSHDVWSFWYVVGFCWLEFCLGFLHLC